MRLFTLQTIMTGLVICFVAATAEAVVIADSAADFTATGTQGQSNWFGGYYNLTQDQNTSDGIYQTGDFIPFTNLAGPGGGPVTPGGNHWTGTTWDLQAGAPGPWTELSAGGTHPNGTNSTPGDEHWTIRRYVSPFDAEVDLTWTTRKTNLNSPATEGVTGILYLNGVVLDQATIAGNDGVGVNNSLSLIVDAGDILDLALSPLGVSGSRSDGSDGSANSLNLTLNPIPEPSAFMLSLFALFALAGCGWRRRVNR